jgi:hypothetical protein
MKTYEVRSFYSQPGSYLSSKEWEQAKLLVDFTYPWRDETVSGTQFRALHDANYLYFRFDVMDDQLIAAEEPAGKMAVAQSDRVELFFRKDRNMSPYYCLEMDWKGRLLDNSAHYYRQMDYQWNWPEGLTFRSIRTDQGYRVEGVLSKTSLRRLNLLQRDQIETGIFRAEYQKTPEEQVKWISWVVPNSPTPDFHIPSAFGVLKLI